MRAPDLSGHCRTSTASARSQWALPGLNHELQISVGDAGPLLQLVKPPPLVAKTLALINPKLVF